MWRSDTGAGGDLVACALQQLVVAVQVDEDPREAHLRVEDSRHEGHREQPYEGLVIMPSKRARFKIDAQHAPLVGILLGARLHLADGPLKQLAKLLEESDGRLALCDVVHPLGELVHDGHAVLLAKGAPVCVHTATEHGPSRHPGGISIQHCTRRLLSGCGA